jgi:hypothetical protein
MISALSGIIGLSPILVGFVASTSGTPVLGAACLAPGSAAGCFAVLTQLGLCVTQTENEDLILKTC